MGIAFNSLSLDHGITGLWDRMTGLMPSFLSTPSLGITEPDSGIFRLSAAFCRGAPSHN
jgi:hypothetical protein